MGKNRIQSAPPCWMAVDGLKKQPQWPHLDPHDGCFHGMLQCKPQEHLQHEPNESEDTDEGLQMTTLRMVTYNALSMRCKANQVAIACMLHRNSVDVAGFQAQPNMRSVTRLGPTLRIENFARPVSVGNMVVRFG